MKAHNQFLLSGVAAIAMLANAAPAMAQAAPADAAEIDDSNANEIIVTAQKREQNLQNVPISMEVVSGAKLAEFNTSDIKAVMNYTPNVFVQSTAGNDVIYIRGFGSPPANFAFDQSVSLYVDGIYAGRNRQAQAPFFDLARVEVLRGPQGALFGKNTAAGAVSVVSAGPTKEFEGAITGLYNFDHKGTDFSGYLSGPITDTLGARFAYKIVNQDGYIYNRATDHDDPEIKSQLLRLTLKWEPSANFDYTAKVEYGNREVIGGITVSSPLTSGQDPQTSRYLERSALGDEGNDNKSVMISGVGNLALGDFTLTSVTGYSWFKSKIVNGFDQTIPNSGGAFTSNSVYNAFPERFDQISQEIRILSPTGKTFEFIVGAYYDKSNYTLEQYQGFNIPSLNIPGVIVGPYFGRIDSVFNQEAESWSVFGQGTFNITEAFRAIGSLRYSHTKKDGDFAARLVYGSNGVNGQPFALRPISSAAGKISEGNVDPSITLQYDIAPRIMVYGTWGRGSKSGGFVSNTLGTTNATFTFEPEQSENFEAGIKSTLFDGKVVANVSAYHTKFKDLQVSVYQPATSSYLTGNAAAATSKGIEGSLSIYPIENFDISASAAYSDIKYDDYPGAACLASQVGCTPATNNLAGYPVAYASKWTGSVTAHARFDMSEDLKLDITGVAAGRSKYFNSDNQSPIFGVQDGYVKLDLRVQLADRDNSWHLALVGKNLTNQKTIGSAFNLPAPITPVPRAILYLEPTRNISVEAGIKF
ncbi:iron complex outermembrane recepter protein [Sphingopyxis sp. YR583]|jgi:iron complex outermembrane receptor protein|uniref:TonB-dependent receptor n=1 Tax=Sphingopyxis sp. YR583 TaxID=1881047 RepID=UPI0008A795A6|nr:TonB-dependent receptor [Sphingopyxis sp. YR583]SEH20387.1 iron complex outermembrane recepter protein [Sphingopyxis sp. YR583]